MASTLFAVVGAAPAAAAPLPPSYAAPIQIPTGNEPATTALVDADLDGDLDVVVANVQSASVSVIENLGGGAFGAPVDVPAGTSPTDISTGDFDGDGLIDLAITNREPPRQVTILHGDGAGSFGSPQTVGTGGRPHFLDAADLNGDGLLDLVVTHCCSSGTLNFYVSVLMATGPSTFAAPTNYSTAAGMATGVHIADFDGDGDQDFVASLRMFGYVSIWTNDGSGSFTPSYVSIPLYDLEIADLDGDGLDDLVVGDYATPNVWTLRNTSSPAAISFAAPVQLSVPAPFLNGIAGDMDGDGVDDVVVTHQALGAVSIVLGSSTGSPTVTGPFTAAPSPNRGSVGDLDGDGTLDIAITSQIVAGSAVILLNDAVPPACGVGPVFVVDEFIDDDGTATAEACSLREAVAAADAFGAPATVEVPAGTYVRSLVGSGPLGDLDITGDVTLVGAGAASTIIDAAGIEGVFEVEAGGRLAISGVTLTGGSSSGLTIRGAVEATDIVISGNSSLNGGAINIGGSASSLTLHNSTLANNSSTFEGGAINHSSAGPVRISNTTITGNTAGQGGVLVTRGTSDTYIENSTMVGNSAGDKGGIAPINSSTVQIRNSVLAANTTGSGLTGADCDIALVSQGHNVFGNCAGVITPATGDVFLGIVPVASLVEPLGDNGGLTPTMLPVAGGPLIDAGSPDTPGTGGLSCVETDQRGVSRLGDRCDAGSVEGGTIDNDAPVVVLVSPADGAVFDQGESVVAEFSCTDVDLVSCVGTVADGDAVDTSVVGSFTFSVTGTDGSGNVTTVEHAYEVVDSTAPVVVLVSPGDGAVFEQGASVVAEFLCTDADLVSCVGTVADGDAVDTSAVGSFTFSVTGTDGSERTTWIIGVRGGGQHGAGGGVGVAG
ncbi:MAG: FG-GAP-like repeat-containing protein [Acidimicrobiales bacterium]